jgi:hypothetical protein
VATLSIFPQAVIDRAVDPVEGLPGKITYLNLAQMRKHLDAWADEYYEREQRRERASRMALDAPPIDPQMQKRVSDGFEKLVSQLKRGIGPSTQTE